MIKPYIYFCGDETLCRNIMQSFRGRIKAVFVSGRNSERLLSAPKRHPSLICMIFSKGMYANHRLFGKILKYSADTRCPLHIAGSRRNLETASKHGGAFIQRSDLGLMEITINRLCEYVNDNPDGELALMKYRFEAAAVISSNAASLALCENKASLSEIKPRVIAVSEKCENAEFERLKETELSGIISDAPLTDNSLKLFSRVSRAEAPAILLNRKERYGRKLKLHYLDSKTESGRITELLTEHGRRKSKLLYLRNK